jgi:hypothetical protein
MATVVLAMTMSLDGYIAGPDDKHEWMRGGEPGRGVDAVDEMFAVDAMCHVPKRGWISSPAATSKRSTASGRSKPTGMRSSSPPAPTLDRSAVDGAACSSSPLCSSVFLIASAPSTTPAVPASPGPAPPHTSDRDPFAALILCLVQPGARVLRGGRVNMVIRRNAGVAEAARGVGEAIAARPDALAVIQRARPLAARLVPPTPSAARHRSGRRACSEERAVGAALSCRWQPPGTSRL